LHKDQAFVLKTTITSAALSPTGALRQTSEFLIVSTTSSGSALPVCSRALSPAINLEISNSRPYFS